MWRKKAISDLVQDNHYFVNAAVKSLFAVNAHSTQTLAIVPHLAQCSSSFFEVLEISSLSPLQEQTKTTSSSR